MTVETTFPSAGRPDGSTAERDMLVSLSEAARLEALRQTGLLDTPPDQSFDRITAFAQDLFDTPIALVSLIDECRQWFKSAQGLDVSETPRELAFCDHAIRSPDVMVVEDAASDPRFAANPLVTGPPDIRFYAGAPLVLPNGAALGTLCVIDRKPRSFSAEDRARLEQLAAMVLDAIASHHNRNAAIDFARSAELLASAEQSAVRLGEIIEHSTCEVCIVDPESFQFHYVNEGARGNLGYSLEEFAQKTIVDMLPEFSDASFRVLLDPLLDGEKSGVQIETRLQRKAGADYPCELRLEVDRSSATPAIVVMATDRSEQQEQAESLRFYSELNQSILDSAQSGVMSAKPIRDDGGEVVDYEIVAMNPASERISGRRPEDLLGRPILQEFPALQATGLYEIYHRVAQTGVAEDFEAPYDGNGADEWFRISAVRTGADGFTITFTPITEMKRQQLALKKLHELGAATDLELDQFIERLLDLGRESFGRSFGFCSRIADGRYTVLGVRGGLEGVTVGDVLPLEDTLCATVAAGSTPQAFAEIGDDPKLCHLALPTSPFGSYIGAPIFVDGALYGTMCFVDFEAKRDAFSDADIDLVSLMASRLASEIEIEQAQQALRQNRDELKFILDNVPARIWYKDDKNRILRLNKPAALSMGFDDTAALEGADTYELFPEMAAKYHRDDLEVIEGGEPLRNIVEAYTPRDGEPGWSSTDKIPAQLQGGERTLLVVSSDVTRLKQREQQLEALNRNLQDFASIAAHDLQSPLRQIAMLLGMVRESLEDDGYESGGEVDEMLADARGLADRQRAMIRSLHKLSSVELYDGDREQVDLAECVRTAVAQQQQSFDESGAEIEIGDLAVVSGVAPLLTQLFQNLVANSVKYCSDDAPRMKVYGKVDPLDVSYKVVFEDNGLGIPAEFAETVFEPFKRLDHSRKVDGAGIGLAFCRKIANEHGGDLTVDTSYEGGTRLVVKFSYG